MEFRLNENATRLCATLQERASMLRVECHDEEFVWYDFGIHACGGLEAGVILAEICLAGLAKVSLAPNIEYSGPSVVVQTDHPVAACMASQYAGWKISRDSFFAMGSGPMRAAAGREDLFRRIGYREFPSSAVGVLETRQTPPPTVCREIAKLCSVPLNSLTLLVAPTASQAGTIQSVARTVETALHKMFELQFDLSRIVSGYGVAPLPPVAADDLSGIGRTNDAVLYGGRVTLWVRGDDESLDTIIGQIPSNASSDYGQPFAVLFERCGRDFYKMDPLLFSPAVVKLVNVDTGRSFQAGATQPDVLAQSFRGG